MQSVFCSLYEEVLPIKTVLTQRAKELLAHAMVYILLYFVSSVMNELSLNHDPKGMYLFGWTIYNNYWNVWMISLALALFGSKIWAWTVTLGNLTGVLVGQFLGDFLYELGYFQTGFHPGFRIWILFVLVSILAGGIAELVFYFKIPVTL